MDVLVDAICSEIERRNDYLDISAIDTVYFGGGTPSLLSTRQLEKILTSIHQNFSIAEAGEITLEANPDDVDNDLVAGWKSLGINRISLGIQTFDDQKLNFINRSHDSRQANAAIELIAANFKNYTADLIYAIPPADKTIWRKDILKLLTYDPPHISVYGLTIEEQTVFGKWSGTGKLTEISDSENLVQYQLAISMLEDAGYIHYEVSNFSKPGRYSLHNTSYWKGEKYLGIGPGAHSYNTISRGWNIRNNHKYIEAIRHGQLPLEEEVLTKSDKQNEYMLTRIRNIWGVDLEDYNQQFAVDFLEINQAFIRQLIKDQYAELRNNRFFLTKKGWFVADEISSRLMV